MTSCQEYLMCLHLPDLYSCSCLLILCIQTPALHVHAATFFKISPFSLDEFQVVLWLSERTLSYNNMWICSVYYQSGHQWHRWSDCNRRQSSVAERTTKAQIHFYALVASFNPPIFHFPLRKFCLYTWQILMFSSILKHLGESDIDVDWKDEQSNIPYMWQREKSDVLKSCSYCNMK